MSTSLCYTWKLKYTAWCHVCLCFCFFLFLKGRGHVAFNIISHRASAQGIPHCRQMEDFRHGESLAWFSFLFFFTCHELSPHLFFSWISMTLFVQFTESYSGYCDMPPRSSFRSEGIISSAPESVAGTRHSAVSP